MWIERQEQIRLLYRLIAELRVSASRSGMSATDSDRMKKTVEALAIAIASLEIQVCA